MDIDNIRLTIDTDGTPFATSVKIGDLDIGQFCTGIKTEIRKDMPNTATLDFEMVAYNFDFHAKNVKMSLESIKAIEEFLGAIRTANGYGQSYTDSGT